MIKASTSDTDSGSTTETDSGEEENSGTDVMTARSSAPEDYGGAVLDENL